MRCTTIIALSVISATAFAAPAGFAQAPVPGQQERQGRFALQPVDGGGVLRLDTETGAMSYCIRQGTAMACEPVSVTDQSKEVERLTRENEQLKADMKRLEDLSANAPQTDDRQAKRTPKFELPSEQDVDKAFDYMERMLKKFRDRMKNLEGRDRTTL